MQLIESTLPGVVIIEPTVHSDARGWFMESFHAARFHAVARAAQRSLGRSGEPAPQQPAFLALIERVLHWHDAGLGIGWPLHAGIARRLGRKDAEAPTVAKADVFERAT